MTTLTETADKLRLPAVQPAHEALADALRRQILLGSFPLGSRLPTERDIAPALGVSRNTARQAIKILADQGLVSTTLGRNGGSIVTQPAFPARARQASFARWRATLDDSYSLRLTLQPLASRWAAERATPVQRRSILKLSQAVPTDIFQARAQGARWAWSVVAAARQPMLLDAIMQIRDALLHELNLLWILPGVGRPSDFTSDAWQTFSGLRHSVSVAIGDGDADRAEAAMITHLEDSRARYFDKLESMVVIPGFRGATAQRARVN